MFEDRTKRESKLENAIAHLELGISLPKASNIEAADLAANRGKGPLEMTGYGQAKSACPQPLDKPSACP